MGVEQYAGGGDGGECGRGRGGASQCGRGGEEEVAVMVMGEEVEGSYMLRAEADRSVERHGFMIMLLSTDFVGSTSVIHSALTTRILGRGFLVRFLV